MCIIYNKKIIANDRLEPSTSRILEAGKCQLQHKLHNTLELGQREKNKT